MTLPRYRRPALRPLGRRATRKAPVRRVEYAAVSRRAAGRCELCGCAWEELAGRSLSPHHAFGRGHLPGIPSEVCETRELILGVCMNWPPTGHQGCHEAIHSGDARLGDRARGIAAARFVHRHGLTLPSSDDIFDDPLEVMRQLVRELEARTG